MFLFFLVQLSYLVCFLGLNYWWALWFLELFVVEIFFDLEYGNIKNANKAAEVLKTQVFLYDADYKRLGDSYKNGNQIAKNILKN